MDPRPSTKKQLENLLDWLDEMFRYPIAKNGWKLFERLAKDTGPGALGKLRRWYEAGEMDDSGVDRDALEASMRDQLMNASARQVREYWDQAAGLDGDESLLDLSKPSTWHSNPRRGRVRSNPSCSSQIVVQRFGHHGAIVYMIRGSDCREADGFRLLVKHKSKPGAGDPEAILQLSVEKFTRARGAKHWKAVTPPGIVPADHTDAVYDLTEGTLGRVAEHGSYAPSMRRVAPPMIDAYIGALR